MSVVRPLLAVVAGLGGLLLILPVLVLGAPFWVVALTVRGLARRLEPPHSPWGAFIEFDPDFGWRSRPGVAAYLLGDEDVYRVTTDADGWRGRGSIAQSDVVVLGDSFAWGQGIDDRHFFAHRVPGARVKAIGVMGYNMVQQLLWLRHLQAQLAGKLVVWLIYLGNDLFENLMPHMQGYRMPFVRETGRPGGDGRAWEIVTAHLRPWKWWESALEGRIYHQKLAEYCTPAPAARRAFAACEFLLAEGKRACDAAGARLVVLTIPEKTQLHAEGIAFLRGLSGDPDGFDPRRPDRTIRAMCERLDIPFVAGAEHLSVGHYKDVDCHWNADGHRQVAQLLGALHRQHGQPAAGRLALSRGRS